MNHKRGDIVLFSFRPIGSLTTVCEIISIDEDIVTGKVKDGSTIQFRIKNITVNYNNLQIILTPATLQKLIDQRIDPVNLEPCPWCNSIPNIWNSGVRNHVYIQCSNRKCSVQPITEGYIIKAITNWNNWNQDI